MNGADDSQPRQRPVIIVTPMKRTGPGCLLLALTRSGCEPRQGRARQHRARIHLSNGQPKRPPIPALDRRFRTEAAKTALAERSANARRRAEARHASRSATSISQFYSMTVDAPPGRRARLLSLQDAARRLHGRSAPQHELRRAAVGPEACQRKSDIDALFLAAGRFPATDADAYCKALDAERRKRRQGEKLELAEFDAMPEIFRARDRHPSTRTRTAGSTTIALRRVSLRRGALCRGRI